MQKYFFAVSFGMSYPQVGQYIPMIPGTLLENFYFRMNTQYPAKNHRIFWAGSYPQGKSSPTLKLERIRNKVWLLLWGIFLEHCFS